MLDSSYFSLEGKKGLVIGIANEHSIAYGCARAFRTLGAELAITYLNEKARAFVEPAAQAVGATLFLRCDVMAPGELEAVFEAVREQWGRLDFVVHSIAFAPREDLQGRLVDSSADGFGLAVNLSAHSFLRMARLVEPLMTEGGSLFAMTFHGSEKVLPTYRSRIYHPDISWEQKS
ncbi:SDR family oxidoreductase [Thiocystis minor]|uniref:SDR family oxidoreductase n=1 Tax=Thiocystis minor TaxID=61597 RepID=UPI001F5E2CA6|nr:SDR family oxidoreductase [Thiocystis minor]